MRAPIPPKINVATALVVHANSFRCFFFSSGLAMEPTLSMGGQGGNCRHEFYGVLATDVIFANTGMRVPVPILFSYQGFSLKGGPGLGLFRSSRTFFFNFGPPGGLLGCQEALRVSFWHQGGPKKCVWEGR